MGCVVGGGGSEVRDDVGGEFVGGRRGDVRDVEEVRGGVV